MTTDLSKIAVTTGGDIFIVGTRGVVLRGNAGDGFRKIPNEAEQYFTGVTIYDDVVFLASDRGLFTYDARSNSIDPVVTNLRPDLVDAHQVGSFGKSLWSFGFKDLAVYNGTSWTRVRHPDNPPI